MSAPPHRLVDATSWRQAASSSSSLYVEVTGAEADELRRDAGLRIRLEGFLASHGPGVRSLLFVHVVDRQPHSVAELYRDGTGAMLWQIEPGPA